MPWRVGNSAVWRLYRLGYDHRALSWHSPVAIVVLPLSYFVGNPGEHELGLWIWRKTTDHVTGSAIRSLFNARLSYCRLSANAPVAEQNFWNQGLNIT